MSRDEIRAFNAKLVDLFYEGHSVTALAVEYGRSVSTINKLIQNDKIENGPRVRVNRPHDPRVIVEKKALSNRHAWIGSRIGAYRARNNLSTSQLGMKLKVSRVQVANMELGDHDFTLTQISRIAEVIGVPVETLLNGAPKLYDEGKAA